MGVNLNNEVSSYFLERFQAKRDMQAAILAEYPNNVGTTFSSYGSKISSLYGNDVLERCAAEALSSSAPEYVYKNDTYDEEVGYYSTASNRVRRGSSISFPGIKVLSVDSVEKFMFWFIGEGVSSITFPDLSVLAVGDDFHYSKMLDRYYLDPNTIAPTPDKGIVFNAWEVNAPNLKYVSERLLPRRVYWSEERDPRTGFYGFGPEVDEPTTYYHNSVSAFINTNYTLEKIPDDFVLDLEDHGDE